MRKTSDIPVKLNDRELILLMSYNQRWESRANYTRAVGCLSSDPGAHSAPTKASWAFVSDFGKPCVVLKPWTNTQ